MRPTAWRFSCSTYKHARTGYREVAFDVTGDKPEAMKAARAKGWKPCGEAMRSGRSLTDWWCPECVSSYMRHMPRRAPRVPQE